MGDITQELVDVIDVAELCHRASDQISELRRQLGASQRRTKKIEDLITAWADAYMAADVAVHGTVVDVDAYVKACDALRKAVER